MQYFEGRLITSLVDEALA